MWVHYDGCVSSSAFCQRFGRAACARARARCTRPFARVRRAKHSRTARPPTCVGSVGDVFLNLLPCSFAEVLQRRPQQAHCRWDPPLGSHRPEICCSSPVRASVGRAQVERSLEHLRCLHCKPHSRSVCAVLTPSLGGIAGDRPHRGLHQGGDSHEGRSPLLRGSAGELQAHIIFDVGGVLDATRHSLRGASASDRARSADSGRMQATHPFAGDGHAIS